MSNLTKDTTLISSQDLFLFLKAVFEANGFSNAHANQSAEVLIAADLRGIDSHGAARLEGYCRLIKAGRINPTPNLKITKSRGVNFTVDADGAIGLVSAPWAMAEVKNRTELHGAGFAAIGNSNHYGIAGYHAMKALDFDAIGFSMTNASPLVSVAGGKERLLGTNPIAIAVPAGKQPPFVLDMATSAAANGKLQIASRKEESIPTGWATDQEGKDSTDANALKTGGNLLPLGSNMKNGMHKGYGLGSWVDIFCGVLSGANFGPWVPPFVSFLQPLANLPGKGLGHFVGAWSVDGFMELDEFKQRMDVWIERFKLSEPLDANTPVMVPGEPEMIHYNDRVKNGIPLNNKILGEIRNIGSSFNVILK
ncbi:Ldh family oxidoreductase [Bacteroidia bacterium]|jgi:LDH2 family malate/lactate/ureidoglycolate dehydrogenase|nr:Ldh family oxidoreductase [Bacteroidia bacterium]